MVLIKKCNHGKVVKPLDNIRYYCIKGPKGDPGVSKISVRKTETIDSGLGASVDSFNENNEVFLEFKIPKGADGATGPKGDLGPTGPQGEIGPRGLPGEIGRTERIVVDRTETVEPTDEASVIDDFELNVHHLTFYIPKGEKGDTSSSLPTSYNAIFYAGFNETKDSKSLVMREKILIPDKYDVFNTPTVSSLEIKATGIYEIMLCGKINGITEQNGAKVFLLNTTTGEVINNLSFEINEGTTKQLIFSGSTITQLFAPASFEVKASITSDPIGSNITFSDVTLIMKKYNI